MTKGKYGIVGKYCGVYMITCIKNGKRYIGSSNHITSRFSNHMNRDSKLYPHREFYQDVNRYSYTGFRFEILEECDESDLLSREIYYYNKIKPEYNLFEPSDNLFSNPDYQQYLNNRLVNNKDLINKRTELYNTAEYKSLFRNVQKDRMKSVDMYDISGEYITSFNSMSEAARWLDVNTKYTGKNKVSKIKAVCDGDRKTAYGYKFTYSK